MKKRGSENDASKVGRFFELEEYDSDAVMDDASIDSDPKSSNISNTFNVSIYNLIKEHVQNQKRMFCIQMTNKTHAKT